MKTIQKISMKYVTLFMVVTGMMLFASCTAADSGELGFINGLVNSQDTGDFGINLQTEEVPDTDTWPGTILFGTTSDDITKGVATDSAGNIYVAGHTKGSLDGHENSGLFDAFLVKYSTLGNMEWTRQVGTSENDIIEAVTVSKNGDIYMVGYTKGSAPAHTNAGGSDYFLVKYNSVGIEQWVRQGGTSLSDRAYGISTDSAGNIYITGATKGDLDKNTNAGGNDIFLVKYNSSGARQWTKQFGTAGHDYGRGVSIDNNGLINIAGYTNGNLDDNPNAGGYDAFLVQYSASGDKLWTRLLGTAEDDRARGISTDSAGTIYISGETQGTLGSTANEGNKDAFLAKYNSAGDLYWVSQIGDNGNDVAYGVSVGSDGNIYYTGKTTESLNGKAKAAVVSYDSSGQLLWGQILDTPEKDVPYGISIDGSGNVFIAGETDGNMGDNTNAGNADSFLAKYDSAGVLQ